MRVIKKKTKKKHPPFRVGQGGGLRVSSWVSWALGFQGFRVQVFFRVEGFWGLWGFRGLMSEGACRHARVRVHAGTQGVSAAPRPFQRWIIEIEVATL